MVLATKEIRQSADICPNCGFEAKSPSGLVNHQRQGGCQKLKYRSLKQEGVFGEVGVLAYDAMEDKVQCHICGKWFQFLAGHLRTHGITVFEYKEQFGLNRNHALCGKENSLYRSKLCTKLRSEGKFNLMPPPAEHPQARLETNLNRARRERTKEERGKLSTTYKARLRRYRKRCTRCSSFFWVKAVSESLLAYKKYCPACRHIVKLERRKEDRVERHAEILERERTLKLIKREGEFAQIPVNWDKDLAERRSAKAKEFWQRSDAYYKRSIEVKCISCETVFRVLAFLEDKVKLCPNCRLNSLKE